MPGKHNAGGCGCCGEEYPDCWGCPMATHIILTNLLVSCVSPASTIDLSGTYALDESYQTGCLAEGVGDFPLFPECGIYLFRTIAITASTVKDAGLYKMYIGFSNIGIASAGFRSEAHDFRLEILDTEPCPTGAVSIPFIGTVNSGLTDPLGISVPTCEIVFP
jgi:hypothetical protein